MSDHAAFRDWAAAYVLGSLEAAERSEFETHLASCDECRARVAEFAPIPGLLSRVEPVDNPPVPGAIAELAVEQVRSDWTALRRSRTRWRSAAVAAAVLVIGLVAVLGLGLQDDPGQTLEVKSEAATTGHVVLISKTWGTEVEIDLQDLPADDHFVAWVVSTDGGWEQVAAWGPTPLNGARVTGASSVATSEVESVVITTGDDRHPVASATAHSDP